MKCEHGNEVSATLTPYGGGEFWDDGVQTFDEDGQPLEVLYDDAEEFVTVFGCQWCRTIRVVKA